MKCRSLTTYKSREFHIKKGEVYDYEFYSNGNKYDAIVIKNKEGNSFTTNPTWFNANFITLDIERDLKLEIILK